jgi:hypothetical protein
MRDCKMGTLFGLLRNRRYSGGLELGQRMYDLQRVRMGEEIMGEKFLLWLIAVLGVGGAVMVTLESCNDSEARRIHAQVALTHARSQATEATLAMIMPYFVLGVSLIVVVLVISLVIFGLIHMANVRTSQPRPRPQPTRQLSQPPIINNHHTHNYFLVSDIDFNAMSDRQVLKRLTGGRIIRENDEYK